MRRSAESTITFFFSCLPVIRTHKGTLTHSSTWVYSSIWVCVCGVVSGKMMQMSPGLFFIVIIIKNPIHIMTCERMLTILFCTFLLLQIIPLTPLVMETQSSFLLGLLYYKDMVLKRLSLRHT